MRNMYHIELFLDAIRQFGSHVPYDYASGDALGGYWAPNTLDPHNETRSYARPTHYEPVKLRSNLHLLANNTVIQIVFDGATATGVKVGDKSIYPYVICFNPLTQHCYLHVIYIHSI
jgi:hypothetical protein